MKKRISDFAAAFVISACVFVCIALVSTAGFFEDAVKWDKEEMCLEVFDFGFEFDKDIMKKLHCVIKLNDTFTFDGFSDVVVYTSRYAFDYIKELITILYSAVRSVSGIS